MPVVGLVPDVAGGQMSPSSCGKYANVKPLALAVHKTDESKMPLQETTDYSIATLAAGIKCLPVKYTNIS